MGTINEASDHSEIGQRAEKKLKDATRVRKKNAGASPERMASLIHELQVHQIELQIQNDELRIIQHELELSQEKYAHLYDFAPIGYFTVSAKGIIVEVNLTGAGMIGMERRALIGKPFTRIVLREDRDIFYKLRQRLLETETSQSCELRLVKKDGHAFHVRMESMIIIEKGDDERQIRAAFSDITERKTAEAALQINTNDLKKRIKELDCFYKISDLREKPGISLGEFFLGTADILAKSFQFQEITCARISIEGDAYETENFHETEWKLTSSILVNEKAVGNVAVYYLEEKPERDEGPFFKDERKLIDAVAVRLGRVVIFHQTMKEIRKANEILEKRDQILTQRLSRLALRLTMAEEHERRRIAEILHDDLQQLLVAVKLNLENLFLHIRPDTKEDVQEIYAMILETNRISRVLTAELSPPVLKRHGLIPALEWLANFFQKTYGLSVELQLEPQVAISRESLKVLLFRCVRELLFNAYKHARVNSAHLSMTLIDSHHVCIAVKDKGIGFDPHAILNDNNQDIGFGLLSIKERLGLINGRFEVHSAPGKGTECKLIIPMSEDEAYQIEERAIPEKRVPVSCDREQKFCILLVDDHDVIRAGLSSLLKAESDFEIVGEASDGEQAVALARKLRPNVILMDIRMPGMDGLEATAIISSEFPDIRIIGLSMYDDSETRSAILTAGGVGYLTKDGGSEALVAAIRNLDSTG